MSKRLKALRTELNLTQEEFARILGIGKSALCMIETGRSGLSDRNRNILIQELRLNPEWFDTGKGDMFTCPREMIPYLRRSDRLPASLSVPLYNLGDTSLAALLEGRSQAAAVDYINIPGLPNCDGAVQIVGDAMSPILKSSDIVIYKQLRDPDNIFWGNIYLLSIDMEGQEYITVKYVHKSENPGFVCLGSENPDHADKEIDTSRIRALALVKASIRMNTAK